MSVDRRSAAPTTFHSVGTACPRKFQLPVHCTPFIYQTVTSPDQKLRLTIGLLA